MLPRLALVLAAALVLWGAGDVAAPGSNQHVVADAIAPQLAPAGQHVEHVPPGPGVDVHAVTVPEPAPVVEHEPAAVVDIPAAAWPLDGGHEPDQLPAPELLDPEHPEYAPQLPEEVIGRAVDCPDGQVGYVVDVDGTVRCPAE